jgi:exosome complex component CSL4
MVTGENNGNGGKLEQKIVLPGEPVGTTEEYSAGDLTYEKDGKIYAAALGEVEVDGKDMSVSVKPKNPPNVLKPGDIVIGMVRDLREKMALVTVLKVDGKKRSIAGETDASLQISQISKNYVKTTRDEFRVGDLIKARVTQASPSLQLSTTDNDLGVVRALCHLCRNPMEKKGNTLHCADCDSEESRKVATDYGEVKL